MPPGLIDNSSVVVGYKGNRATNGRTRIIESGISCEEELTKLAPSNGIWEPGIPFKTFKYRCLLDIHHAKTNILAVGLISPRWKDSSCERLCCYVFGFQIGFHGRRRGYVCHLSRQHLNLSKTGVSVYSVAIPKQFHFSAIRSDFLMF